ncbi:MAG: dockerin type I domain-containing protein [Planctomycetota bacterium]|jgi:hypothetical protein
MMGQAARDPVWHAALAVANADAKDSGEYCIRCHSPIAWLNGSSMPSDASGFNQAAGDFDGVSCNFCHRAVDPVYTDGTGGTPVNPVEDVAILAGLGMSLPTDPGNGRYIADPLDVRRGPLDDVPANFHGVPILVSPFHTESLMCASCHDLSNPVYEYNELDGTYDLTANDSAHPTQNPHDMMPEQRTYSEWLNSDFATTGVVFPDNRFGGDHEDFVIGSCQDCHMPRQTGGICAFWSSDPFFPRTHVPRHAFNGANTWVLDAVREVDVDGDMMPDFPDFDTGLDATKVADAQARTTTMLQNASDMQLRQVGDMLKVRIINMSGHKLPTGYPEGRRMWLNVEFLDGGGGLVAEHGAYAWTTGETATGDTKVYEAKFGLDGDAASATGLPAGESFHLALNNQVLKDNRIPPMGFTNAAFEAIRAAPVAATYADGQYWDDTEYAIPPGAADAIVTLWYQTTTKEYAEFLRDSLGGTNAWGQAVHTVWQSRLTTTAAPVAMDSGTIMLVPSPSAADVNVDGVVDVSDLLQVLGDWGPCPPPDLCAADTNCDGSIDVTDLLLVLADWS